jgi:hypothetical protein
MRSPSEKGPDPANQVKIKKKEENERSKRRLESRSEQESKLRLESRSAQESGSKAALALVVFSLRILVIL